MGFRAKGYSFFQRKKAHKHKLFALVNVQMALGQTAGCPRVNRAKKFMCSPQNTGNIDFCLWLTGGLSQGCPDFQKVYVFKVYVPFPCPIFLGLKNHSVRVARLQNEVGTKYFFRGANVLTKNAPKVARNVWAFILCVRKNPQNFLPKITKKKITDELPQERRGSLLLTVGPLFFFAYR